MSKKIVGASIGNDIHVAGLLNFLNLAKKEGYETIYLGGAVPIEKLIGAIIEVNPDIVAISYRLGEEPLKNLLDEFIEKLKKIEKKDLKIVFGGTIETGKVAKNYKIFEKVFDGSEEVEDVLNFIKGGGSKIEEKEFPQNLPDRIKFKEPYALIRHHIGLQTMEETIEEVKKLSESKLLDIISIAPDQNCQSYFFEKDKMDEKLSGAGGAPIRSEEDFKKLYEASRRGNFPLMRCYSGTRDMVKFSKVLKETLNNAWAAIPIFWYSDLDRRSDRELLSAIKENMEGIKWNGENGVPVEVNDSHQWELRNAHDTLAVFDSYLVAYIAKELGVKHYIQQYMLNTPPNLSPKMDIAKSLARMELVESLEDENFKTYRMIRTGLLSYPSDPYQAMGQLVSSMFYGSYLKPHIIHVVAYTEAIKRATSKEILESVKMVKKAYLLAETGLPDFIQDKDIRNRVYEIKDESLYLIEKIKEIGKDKKDPLIDPETLYNAVKFGILDAPGLTGFSVAKGEIRCEVINGANYAVDENGKILKEKDRLKMLN
ncbi:MAG TPA: cobalamin B12-binding domain-containing protein [Caldisericia bacterium]|nr:cobalamin B12-binding domain-containing protein [Caldisericia bacterium]